MSCSEELFHIADIYRTVEMEAYDILGRPIVLVRCVFPPGIKYAHLIPDREIPHKVYSLKEALQKITSLTGSKSTPIHFINDDPALYMQSLLFHLMEEGYEIYLNSYGFIRLSTSLLMGLRGLYLITRPGLYLVPDLIERATEVRAYWKPGDNALNDHALEVHHLLLGVGSADKFILVPYSPDVKTIQETITTAMEWECRVGIHPASLFPDVDKHLQENPESEMVIHQMQRDVLAISKGMEVVIPEPKARKR